MLQSTTNSAIQQHPWWAAFGEGYAFWLCGLDIVKCVLNRYTQQKRSVVFNCTQRESHRKSKICKRLVTEVFVHAHYSVSSYRVTWVKRASVLVFCVYMCNKGFIKKQSAQPKVVRVAAHYVHPQLHHKLSWALLLFKPFLPLKNKGFAAYWLAKNKLNHMHVSIKSVAL